jgi:hypothetical protein
MENPNMRARICQLHKTEAEWNKLPDFVPLCGELIVFDQDRQHRYSRVKIGDGATKLQKLSFLIDPAIDDFLATHYDKVVDAGRVTDYKK